MTFRVDKEKTYLPLIAEIELSLLAFERVSLHTQSKRYNFPDLRSKTH